jgi:hypothetical protein
MIAIDAKQRDEELDRVRAFEEKENLLARHYRALPYEPKFFEWCNLKTFETVSEAANSAFRELTWYRLCQIENDDGLCRDHSERAVSAAPDPATDGGRTGLRYDVILGEGMRLKERPQSAVNLPKTQIASEIAFRPPIERSGMNDAALEPRLIELDLVSSGEVVSLKDDGLKLSYGIFGAPGAGKTRLLMRILRQVLAYPGKGADPAHRFGALILDPKAALIQQVTKMAEAAGRKDDVEILNLEQLKAKGKKVNVLNCSLDRFELGRFLVTVARSAGIGATEPYWFNVMGDVLGAALFLLSPSQSDPAPTLQELMEVVLGRTAGGSSLQMLAASVRIRLDRLGVTCDNKQACRIAIERIERFYADDRQVNTVNSLLSRAYGAFQLDRFGCFSGQPDEDSIYDQIIKEGKIVLVSISPLDPDAAKVLCTLVKCIFQQTVLGRNEHLPHHRRPVVLACDEFSVIATELPGESSGDGYFFALARENGCMGLLATQSVHTLENSSMKESWKSIYSNFAAKIFMRCADVETAEQACRLAGKSEWRTGSTNLQSGTGTPSISESLERKERDHLQARQLTRLKRRQAVVVGTLDGGVSSPTLQFLEVPEEEVS